MSLETTRSESGFAEAEPTEISAENHSPKPNQAGALLVLAGMLGFLFLMGAGLWIWTAQSGAINLKFLRSAPLPVLGSVPEFSLTERGGTQINAEMLKGRIWIADFIFTRCGGTCPMMSKSMSALQNSLERIPELWPPAVLISFTVDPDWDTPDRLTNYAAQYNAHGNEWLFLTGSYDKIQDLARNGFHVGVQGGNDSEVEPIIHSQSLILVDKEGRIRGYYDGTESESLHKIIADIPRLLRERQS